MNRDDVDLVRAGYDHFSDTFDEWASRVLPEFRVGEVEWLLGELGGTGHVLELGSGTGVPVARMLEGVVEYEGIDLSEGMIEVARRSVPGGRFIRTDMRSLDRPAESLDAVVAFYSIIHVPAADQPDLLRRIHRWLTVGGVLVAAVAPEAEQRGFEDDWLGHGPMFWSSIGEHGYASVGDELGVEVLLSERRSQVEVDDPVEFLWLRWRKAG